MARMRPAENSLKYSQHSSEAQGVRESGDCHIAVVGVGRAGNNTVTRLVQSGVTSAKCIAINTDAAHLKISKAHQKILIGEKLTKGHGVHGDPKLGKAAIEESLESVEKLFSDIDVVFITAGLGGGTGAGAAPVVAEIAKRKGAATFGVVTIPFRIEKGRDKYASKSLAEMQKQCDTVVVIDNDKLMQLAPHLPKNEPFRMADQLLAGMISGIVETISTPSLINLDFASFKTIVSHGGMAVLGVGESDAPNRAEEAVRNAFRTPLLDVDYAAATGALIHVTGDNRMTIEEVNRIGEMVTEMIQGNARVIWSAMINPQQEGRLKVTLVMTGVNSPHILGTLGKIAPRLFDMDPHEEPERTLDMRLNLYQMEPGPS